MRDLATRAVTGAPTWAARISEAETPRNVYGLWDTAGIHPVRPKSTRVRVGPSTARGDEDGDVRHG